MDSEPSIKISLHREVQKFLKTLHKDLIKKIEIAFLEIRKNPIQGKNILKLAGKKNQYRYRLGNYRIVYESEFQPTEIFILEITTRENSYKK
jgi:mRNA-degrading endonuclease RelE of RelBE toxin-antitoxin system